jgi:hypothetical protein
MLNIVTALPAEARPVIKHFDLIRHQSSTLFPVYHNNDIRLIISGPGKINAAAATACLTSMKTSQQPEPWLNIGIVGHVSHDIGDTFIAHSIEDAATGERWYPPQIMRNGTATESLMTVDMPDTGYTYKTLIDMEASGFFPIATKDSTAELVQCMKVVSDNKKHPAQNINSKIVSVLITGKLALIESIIHSLVNLARLVKTPSLPAGVLDKFTDQWKFTVTQKHQLESLLRRWYVLLPEQPIWHKELPGKPRASDVLKNIEQRLLSAPVHFN